MPLILILCILIFFVIIVSLIFIICWRFYFKNKKMDQEHDLKILKHKSEKITALSSYKESSIKKNNYKIKNLVRRVLNILAISIAFLFHP